MPAHNQHTPRAQLAGRGRKAPRLAFALTPDENRKLREMAKLHGLSLSALVREAIARYAYELGSRWP